MSSEESDGPEDLTAGLGTDHGGTFAEAEPRIRARIADAIAASNQPAASAPMRLQLVPAGELPDYAAPSSRAPRRSPRRLMLAGASCAAAVAAVVGFAMWSNNSTTTSSSTDQLRQLSAAAASSTDRFDPNTPVVIETTFIERRGDVVVSHQAQLKIAAGGTAYQTNDAEAVVSGDPSSVTLAAGSSSVLTTTTAFGGFSLDEVAGLPTTADALSAEVSERLGAPEGSPAWASAVAALAAVDDLPPTLRAAAVSALGAKSTLPVDGTDPEGRTGKMLAGSGWAALVDPVTGSLVAFASQPTVENPSAPADAAWWTLWH